jgi:hypothetical protein
VKIGFIPPAAEIGHPARDTGFLLARLDELWPRAPHYKPLSVGVVLFDLVPAVLHQPDLFAAHTHRRQKLSPLIDRINDRYGRCAIGFGLLPPEVRAFPCGVSPGAGELGVLRPTSASFRTRSAGTRARTTNLEARQAPKVSRTLTGNGSSTRARAIGR